MSAAPPPPRPITLASTPQRVTLDLHTARRRWSSTCRTTSAPPAAGSITSAHDYRPDRAPIEPLRRLLPVLREAGVPVIWVNWGNRPDLANMPPNQIHLYKPKGVGIGLGDPLPGSGAPVLDGLLGGGGGR